MIIFYTYPNELATNCATTPAPMATTELPKYALANTVLNVESSNPLYEQKKINSKITPPFLNEIGI